MPKFVVSFRVMGENLIPEEISRALALEPTESHRKGDQRPSPEGRKYAPFSEGLWCLTSKRAEKATLNDHLEELLSMLTPRKTQLDSLKKRGLRQDFFIGVFSQEGNPAYGISTQNLDLLHQLPVEVNFDVYS